MSLMSFDRCTDAPNVGVPELAQECLDRGLIQATMGDREEAVRLYRKALAIDPDNALGHYMLALVLMDRGDGAQACAEWRFAMQSGRSGPRDTWARHKSRELLTRFGE